MALAAVSSAAEPEEGVLPACWEDCWGLTLQDSRLLEQQVSELWTELALAHVKDSMAWLLPDQYLHLRFKKRSSLVS